MFNLRIFMFFVSVICLFFLFWLFKNFPYKYTEYFPETIFDKLLILSIIKVESSFIKDAVSPLGAYGLMQVMPQTSEWINKKFDKNYNLYVPKDNIQLGIKYLEYLYELNGNLADALIGYNTGPHASKEVKESAGKRYLKKVYTAYYIYKFLYRGD
ncbi:MULTISPECIES: lytic transglycosylase domain-containing protein [unclassified Thermosipho (in: thermotogales)]|uniref:lytic transglycosylase domain-containing protein n=1 Tax=unclassified Thermosipho (in: thermotogales) TaxID=2676525 RepID=UPI001E3B63D2|nr:MULTISPECIES: transglycosylase SLT domain-containing protein [unclassified Thermosipho (in: thermotogales)]